MPFKIGEVSIDYLNGPIDIFVLEPTNIIKNIIQEIPQIFVFLSDHHGNAVEMCPGTLCKNKICIHTTSPAWYKIIDSIATPSEPIDYFIESFFDTALINDPHYMRIEITKYVLNSPLNTVMSYIANHHLPCFSKNPDLQNSCFTNNIRYHFADIRVDSTKHNINIAPEDNFNINLSLEARIFDILSTAFHTETFYNTEKVLFNLQSIDLLELCVSDSKKFIDIIFDPYNATVYENSRILKQLKKIKFTSHDDLTCIKYFHSLIKEYYLWYLDRNIIDKESLIVVNEAFKLRKQDINIVLIGNVTINRKLVYQTNQRLANATNILAIYYTAPFLELYMFFRSLKHVPIRSKICFLNAGFRHTTYFKEFLVYKGLYTLKYPSLDQKDPLEKIKTPLYRCLNMSENFDFDKYINHRNQITQNRISIFEPRMYIDILNGNMISVDTLNNLMESKENLGIKIKDLDLKNKIVFTEYKNKSSS